MQGYIRVSPKSSNIKISYTLDGDIPGQDEEE
jgi:hypothetical protein